jgi:hypothetical protein
MLPSTPVALARDTDLLDAAWFRSPTWLDDLAGLAQPENWDDEGFGRQPILLNYLRHTFRRQLEQDKWREIESTTGARSSALNTGLLSRHFEPIYGVFEPNRNTERQPWVLTEWASPASPRLKGFDLDELAPAVYFTDPGEAVFDPRLPVVSNNLDHIVDDNVDRFPVELQENRYVRYGMLERAIRVAGAKAKANWRIAAPQYYWPKGRSETGRLQLLLPLAMINENHVDLALVVDRDPPFSAQAAVDHAEGYYRAHTVLPVEWAYRNARLITRPESYWLDPNIFRTDDFEPAESDAPAWRPTSAQDRCPLCGAADGCVMARDNRTALCRNVPSGTEIQSSRGTQLWSHAGGWADPVEAGAEVQR